MGVCELVRGRGAGGSSFNGGNGDTIPTPIGL